MNPGMLEQMVKSEHTATLEKLRDIINKELEARHGQIKEVEAVDLDRVEA